MDLQAYPDWHRIVSRHWRKTTGTILAQNRLCLKIRDDELAAIRANRVLVGLTAKELEVWTPPASWLLAVLLCPGDTTDSVVAWAKKHGAEADRIHFYATPDVNLFDALAAWSRAGLPNPIVDDDIVSWQMFHKRFGRGLAVRILEDWSP